MEKDRCLYRRRKADTVTEARGRSTGVRAPKLRQPSKDGPSAQTSTRNNVLDTRLDSSTGDHRVLDNAQDMVKDIFKYNRFRSTEERIWSGIFWIGILLLIIWIEVCIGIAVARLLLTFD